jgi:hypothetical protein
MKHPPFRPPVPLLIASVAAASLTPVIAGCDRETSRSETSESKVVDTPEGKKKVIEKTETETTTEKKK